MAPGGLKPIRRVVTGNDERGRSKVVWDGPAPNAHDASMGTGRGHIDKTETVDYAILLDGAIVLVLDTQEVHLKAGEFVVQRGTNHAWSNRSGSPAVVAIASHDGAS